jgi:hypothetical protein
MAGLPAGCSQGASIEDVGLSLFYTEYFKQPHGFVLCFEETRVLGRIIGLSPQSRM